MPTNSEAFEAQRRKLAAIAAEEWVEDSDSELELESLEREYEPDPDEYYDYMRELADE